MARTKLRDPDITNVDLVDRPANPEARILLYKRDGDKPMKTEDGVAYPAEMYAYVPDPDSPSTWKLRLCDSEMDITAAQVGAAIAALGKGFRGNKVEIPAEDLPAVKGRVRAAWKKANPDKEDDDMPSVIAKQGGLLHAIAKKLGLTDDEVEKYVGEGNGTGEMFNEAFNRYSLREIQEEIYDFTGALNQSISSIIADDKISDKKSMLDGSIEQFNAAITAAIPEWLNERQEIGKSGRVFSAERLGRLKKLSQDILALIAEGDKQEGDDGKMAGEINKSLLAQEVQDYISKMEAEIETLKKTQAPPPAPDPEEVLKSLDPAVRKFVDDLKAKADAAEAVAKKALDDEKTKTYVAKAAGYTHLGIQTEEFGAVLKSLADKDPESMGKITAVLDAANEAVGKSKLFEEAGSPRTGGIRVTTGVESWGKIVEAAKASIAKSGETVSEEMAVSKFLETAEGKKLYDEYLKERSGK